MAWISRVQADMLAMTVMGLQLLLLLPLAAWATSPVAAGFSRGSLSKRLFENSLKLANLSLDGQFISQMVDGTLPAASFQRYLAQDNLYLFRYARAFALLGSKTSSNDEFLWLVNKSMAYLEEHGPKANTSIDEHDFELGALPVTVAYTDHIMLTVKSDDIVVGLASVLPCQKLYDWLFTTIKATRFIADDNPYKAYIDQYADPRNHHTTEVLESIVDAHAARGIAPEVEDRALFSYQTAMRYEAKFFEQGLTGHSAIVANIASATRLTARSLGRESSALAIMAAAEPAGRETYHFTAAATILVTGTLAALMVMRGMHFEVGGLDIGAQLLAEGPGSRC